MVFALLFADIAAAQQDPMVTQNMFNQLAINPGYAGSIDGIEANAIIRNQYMGFEGAPVTQFFNVHSGLKFLGHKHGVGLSLINDAIGFDNNLGVKLNYAYRTTAGAGDLGIGLYAGFLNKNMKGQKWVYPDGTGGSTDNLVPTTEQKPMVFDMGLGLYYKIDNLYMGLSFAHLTKPEVKYSDGSSFIGRSYFLTVSYNYQLTNPLFELRPSLFICSDIASNQVGINSLLYYNKRFWGGFTYRTVDAISVMAGLEMLGGLQLSIAYDINTSALRTYNSGSLEVMVGYAFTFKVEKDKKTYKSIRYL